MIRLSNRIRKRQKRHVPQLNTTSTADISFMLLIFFLVTTSMDPDKGLRRQLSPKNVEEEVAATDVDRNTVLTVGITADNKYTYSLPGQQTPAECTDMELRKQLRTFIPRLGDKHIIEIQASRSACYDRYFHLQNIIVHVYRDDLKRKYKQRISESYVP